jgi:hypothetical protein
MDRDWRHSKHIKHSKCRVQVPQKYIIHLASSKCFDVLKSNEILRLECVILSWYIIKENKNYPVKRKTFSWLKVNEKQTKILWFENNFCFHCSTVVLFCVVACFGWNIISNWNFHLFSRQRNKHTYWFISIIKIPRKVYGIAFVDRVL